MIKSYTEVRNWLEQFIPYTYSKENLGLERIECLLKLLGNPQKKFKSIHIAGTSGKGSTAFYLARALRYAQGKHLRKAQKQETINNKQETINNKQETNSDVSSFQFPVSSLKVGLHVSPHLVYIGERMQIFETGNRKQETGNKKQERPIAVERLVGLINEIKPVVEGIRRKQPDLIPSYFEILVAASFLYFAQEKVDIAVVEVGLGGRLDATNVLNPELSIITNVGLDHTDILGKTIEEIAREKAGIIKSISNLKYPMSNFKLQKGGVPVVTGCPLTSLRPVRETQGKQAQGRSGSSIPRYNSASSTSGRALEVIEKVAKGKKAPLMTISTLQKQDKQYFDILLNIKDQIDSDLRRGVYVTDECFFLVNLALYKLGIRLSENEQKRVFSARFAARFEEIDDGIIVDGAHNRDKARALINWVKNRQQETRNRKQETKIILVCAFKKGKDWKGILKLLLANLDIDSVIATQFYAVTDTGLFSSVEPEEIKSFLNSKLKIPNSKVKIFKNSQEAVWEAVNSNQKPETRNQKLILVTGSLYLAGEARTIWKLPEF